MGREPDCHLNLMPRLKVSGAIPPLSSTIIALDLPAVCYVMHRCAEYCCVRRGCLTGFALVHVSKYSATFWCLVRDLCTNGGLVGRVHGPVSLQEQTCCSSQLLEKEKQH